MDDLRAQWVALYDDRPSLEELVNPELDLSIWDIKLPKVGSLSVLKNNKGSFLKSAEWRACQVVLIRHFLVVYDDTTSSSPSFMGAIMVTSSSVSALEKCKESKEEEHVFKVIQSVPRKPKSAEGKATFLLRATDNRQRDDWLAAISLKQKENSKDNNADKSQNGHTASPADTLKVASVYHSMFPSEATKSNRNEKAALDKQGKTLSSSAESPAATADAAPKDAPAAQELGEERKSSWDASPGLARFKIVDGYFDEHEPPRVQEEPKERQKSSWLRKLAGNPREVSESNAPGLQSATGAGGEKKSSWFSSKEASTAGTIDDEPGTSTAKDAAGEKKSSWFASKAPEPSAAGTSDEPGTSATKGAGGEKKSSWFSSKEASTAGTIDDEPGTSTAKDIAGEKKSSWFASKAPEPSAAGTSDEPGTSTNSSPQAKGAAGDRTKSSWFATKDAEPPATQISQSTTTSKNSSSGEDSTSKRLIVWIKVLNSKNVISKKGNSAAAVAAVLPSGTLTSMVHKKIGNMVLHALEKRKIVAETSIVDGKLQVIIRQMPSLAQVAIKSIIKSKIEKKLTQAGVQFDLKVCREKIMCKRLTK
ncbi:hypothetical protein CYMTET_9092 [Cymbomonas tetramitiformis]|uniref:PH domain-containing protein n=1 Tax=Cymbomonas tetramitiformis TaxID=36881 RepID=A0AAE0GS64_9CHLO|nr:hypothetical protein CYMTET_9092 [Cymbomonas tetramitiformis]